MRFLRNSLAGLFLLAMMIPLRGEDTPSAVSFQSVLDRIGISYSGVLAYRLDRNYPRGDWDSGRTAFWTVLASSGSVILRLDSSSRISPEDAARDIDMKFSRIRMLYSGNMAYPGLLTQTFKVPDQFLPEEVETAPARLWLLYATPNLTYGAGAEDLIAYKAALMAVYCKERRIMSYLEIFWPKRDFSRAAALSEVHKFVCSPDGVKAWQ